MTYKTVDAYIAAVDAEVVGLCGLSVHDLPDADFWHLWQDEVPPAEAAREILADEGFPF